MTKTSVTSNCDPDLLNVPSMNNGFGFSCSDGTKPPIRHTYSMGLDLDDPSIQATMKRRAAKCDRSLRAIYAKNDIYAAEMVWATGAVVSVSRSHAVPPAARAMTRQLRREERNAALEKELAEQQAKMAKLRAGITTYLQAVASASV